MRVGLPQELTHIEWIKEFKTGLSCLVPDIEWIHTPSVKDRQPLFLGTDACFPFKKMVGTSICLSPCVDLLFIPRVVSLDGYLMCPNFRALPDIVSINIKRMDKEKTVPVISPLMEIADRRQLDSLIKKTAKELISCYGLHGSGNILYGKDEQNVKYQRDISRSIALIGHPYLLEDKRLNNGVPEILKTCDFRTISSTELPFRELDRLAASYDFYAKKMYWKPGREILGAFLYFTRIRRPAGIIQLVAFNCGIEALLRIELMSLYRQMKNPPPYMVIVCDEHVQREHVVTRIEAFLDIINGISIK